MNVLFCGAHPDDIELISGGFISKLNTEGHKVYVLLFTDGSWKNSKGQIIRSPQDGINEAQAAASLLNYNLTILNNKALFFSFSDSLVANLLNIIEDNNIDTLVLPWEVVVGNPAKILKYKL